MSIIKTMLPEIDLNKSISDKLAAEKRLFIGRIDGLEVKSLRDFYRTLAKAFGFSQKNPLNGPAALDWMSDLTWIDADKYCLVINNCDKMLEEKDDDLRYLLSAAKELHARWLFDTHNLQVFEKKATSFRFWLNYSRH